MESNAVDQKLQPPASDSRSASPVTGTEEVETREPSLFEFDPFEVGEWAVEPERFRLHRDGRQHILEPQVMAVLIYLAHHAGRTVPRRELLDKVWQGRAVVDAVLTRAVSLLRQCLGDEAQAPRYIETVPRRGYRLLADVHWAGSTRGSAADPPEAAPESARPVTVAQASWRRIAIVSGVVSLLLATGLFWQLWRSGSVAPTVPAGLENEQEVMRGRYLLSRRTPAQLLQALACFDAVLQRDQESGAAWSGRADSLVLLAAYSQLPPRQALVRAREAAEAALRHAPDLAHAHASQALVRLDLEWNPEAAAELLRQAVQLEPESAQIWHWLGETLSILGRHDAAIEAGRRAHELYPHLPVYAAALAQRHNHAGRWHEALDWLDRAEALSAEFAWLYRERAFAHERLGALVAAAAARQREMELRRLDADRLGRLREQLRQEGLRGFWRWQLETLQADRAAGEVVAAAHLAEAYAGAGELEAARRELGRAMGESAQVLLLLAHSPAFDPLRDERQWQLSGPVVVEAQR